MNLITENIDKISVLCAQSRVDKLYVFGSVTTDRFGPGSDVDFIVVFQPMPVLDYGDCYFVLSEGLEAILQRKIDLISYKAIKNEYFRSAVDRQKRLIYG